MKKIFGYACSKDEDLGWQMELLKKEGVEDRYIFIDGKYKSRIEYSQYLKMKQMLSEGDHAVFCSVDKIGSTISQIYEELEWYKERKITIKILDLSILNSTGLSYEVILSIIVEIYKSIFIIEKNRIRKNQAYGIQQARAAGKYKGRRKMVLEGFDDIKQKIDNKEISVLEGCRRLGINSSTYYRRINQDKKSNS